MEAMTMECHAAAEALAVTDEALALAASDDRRAFLTLYDRYAGRVERYIAMRIGQGEVEDLVSTTFERALSRIHTFRQRRGSFAAWLFAIAHNAIVDRHRTAGRMVELNEAGLVITSEHGVETLVEEREAAMRLRLLLQGLPPDQRDALALRYGADLRFAEVGHALGRSESAAKMLVQRGLRALREELHGEDRR
jgi:RNA polymerase sigma-70 factor (ECF subfamily)